jgi:hypothetical protein
MKIWRKIIMTGYETTNTNATHSSGVAKAGLTLGIIGTSLAGLLAGGFTGNGGGLNIFGGNRNVEENQQSEISALESKIARLESMRYTDLVGIDLYKNIIEVAKEEDAKIAAVQNQMIGYVIDLDKRTALNEQASNLNRAYDTMARDYQMTILNNKIDCCCEKAKMEVDFNKTLGGLADASILSYVNSTFLPGTLKLPITSVCPLPATATTTA